MWTLQLLVVILCILLFQSLVTGRSTMHSDEAIKGTIFETEAVFPFMEDNGSSRAPLSHENVDSLITSTEYSIMTWIQFCCSKVGLYQYFGLLEQ